MPRFLEILLWVGSFTLVIAGAVYINWPREAPKVKKSDASMSQGVTARTLPAQSEGGTLDFGGSTPPPGFENINQLNPPPVPNNKNQVTIPAITKTVQATLKTNKGDIVLNLHGEKAPGTVGNFVFLAKDNFYDGTAFHRIIPDFMIQAGDPLSKQDELKDRWGTGGPNYKFGDEINDRKLVRGSVAMANSGPNTNGSQFFIVTTEATPHLDGKHTNFGEVVSGMDVVDAISAMETDERDAPLEKVVISDVLIKE